MSAAPILRLQDLVRDYRGGLLGRGEAHRALDGVSLELEPGTILGIVGESGSGKTTLARIAAALDRPTSGKVYLAGEDILALTPRELVRRRARFQMVFQDPQGSLNPRRRIGWSVAEPLDLLRPRLDRPEREARVAQMLEAVGLRPADAARAPHEFSGGQRQRIAVARALVTQPDLVIADEAVSALDLSVQAQILNLVLDLRERFGTAFLFITHNLSVVDAICDRVGVMYQGRIVESGGADAVFRHPLHPYTRLLLDAEPSLDKPVKKRRRVSLPFPDEPVDWAGCAFRSRCPLATERCRRETPVLRALGDGGRLAACHHAEAM
ncbi:ABC transporter ATP-binding protein [Aureimonas psammosilenae]|uniref:ABC transporter ATP-binding protein n=1 Tax=Aureimonas psammosilenae TaxID=2495496 RepID=UPI001869C055|nr:oligopeptide/dipeptide ABC transporter ATP-binding protein [Aureimonas psammosilenae]